MSADAAAGWEFSARFFNGSWWSDSELQWADSEGNLVVWDIAANTTRVLVSAQLLASLAPVMFN